MRDYKNVKVPRKYRNTTHRVLVERAPGRRPRGKPVSFARVMLITATAAFCALGLIGYRWASRTEMFQISSVDVKGIRQLGESELNNIAGFFTGQNIFHVDLEAAARQARAHAWVKDVRIERRLPNRISMVFVERAPVAILDSATGRYLVDNDGVVIDKPAPDAAWPLPTVSFKEHKARPGEQVTDGGLVEALGLIEELSARGGWQLADVTVKAGSPESISVVYADQEFRLGSGNYPEKLRRLSEIMSDIQGRGLQVAYVDLRPTRQAAAQVKKSGRREKISNNKHAK